MSLLLDALKRAEEAKRAKAETANIALTAPASPANVEQPEAASAPDVASKAAPINEPQASLVTPDKPDDYLTLSLDALVRDAQPTQRGSAW